MKDLIKLIFAIIICEIAGIAGSIFTFSSITTWYAALNKPFFTPPSFIFGPVWTTLYLLMGVSLYLVWRKGLKDKKIKVALYFFTVQLVLNFLWSIIFFGLHQPQLAFLEIIALWLTIVITIINFKKISPWAAYILIPYLLWVSFASILNLSVALLN